MVQVNKEESFRLITSSTGDEYFFRKLFNLMPQLGWTAQPNGYIDFYNEGWYEYTGTTFEQSQGWGWESVHDPEYLPAAKEKWLHSIETGAAFEMKFPLKGKDGVFQWFLSRVNPIFDDEGKIVRWVGVNTNIQQELDQAHEIESIKLKLDAITNSESIALMVAAVKDYAIFMLDPKGNVQTWNAGAKRIKGYSSNEIIGKHFSIFYSKEARDSKHPEYELQVAQSEGRYEEEGWRYRKDGSKFWANVVITAVNDKAGKLLGFAKVTRDLTERRETELALKQSRDEAIAANEAKSRFLSTVSHEVRTPMAGVIGLVEIMNASAPDDEFRTYSQTALDACKRLLQILNNLLDAAKLQANSVNLEYRHFAMRPVIGDVVQLVTPEANKKGLAVEANVLPDVPELLCGDELRIRQILQNLVFNAVKFTSQGKVTIAVESVKQDAGAVTLKFSVIDTGIGIGEEQQQKIFEPFVQAEDSTTRVYGGTGLGLNIVRTLVELMGGQIGVTSKLGSGSTFWVLITFGVDHCKTA